MEHDGARVDVDVIDSSLKMVRDSAAYIGLIGHKYGQTPPCPRRNPNQLSITELEFDEAMRLGLPILLFEMGEKHPVTKADIEIDPDKRRKLEEFRERAKRMREGSEVERVYEVFDSLEQFSTAAAIAVGRLARYLTAQGGNASDSANDAVTTTHASDPDPALPHPPALAALPKYLGSHRFVGRRAELETLADWSSPADPNPMLLFEAIGGSGKSMLTWEWLTNHAPAARADWAGRFWYSFYEKGAVMAGFCRHALAYMTKTPPKDFAKLRTPELADRLVAELERRPWLLVLDGLERVLVAYHRYDAAQMRDEEADTAVDQIGKRDPCAAIRPEDDGLLRRLAAVAPSKILVSSRLTPLALVNRAGTVVPGVRREILPGLHPADAEAMIRACGVTGRSPAIQAYLQQNCDCHPLVTGALAGLINDYPSDRGNFDRWVEDPHYGGSLNLAALDLVQKRNHILLAAIDAVAPEARQLLQTLALLQSGADFETLKAFNPHLPPEPKKLTEPENPQPRLRRPRFSRHAPARPNAPKTNHLSERQAYLEALASWKDDPAVRAAPARLGETLRDLEKRGLLQYDFGGRRYDLHPVVRGVAAGRMDGGDTAKIGGMIVDHFGSQAHDPWEQADTLEDVEPGLHIVGVLVRMGHYQEAFDAYRGDLARTLLFNLNADVEIQSLLKPFFPDGWDGDAVLRNEDDLGYLLQDAASSLRHGDSEQASNLIIRDIALNLRRSNGLRLATGLRNLALNAGWTAGSRLMSLACDLANALADNDQRFTLKTFLFYFLSKEAMRMSRNGYGENSGLLSVRWFALSTGPATLNISGFSNYSIADN